MFTWRGTEAAARERVAAWGCDAKRELGFPPPATPGPRKRRRVMTEQMDVAPSSWEPTARPLGSYANASLRPPRHAQGMRCLARHVAMVESG